VEAKGNIFGLNADWQAIILCLIAASTFWFFNSMNGDHTADVSYPVEFIYNDEEIMPVKPLPEKIQFNASGFGWNLLRKTLKVNRTPVVIRLDNFPATNFIAASELLPIVKSQLDDIKVNYLLYDTVPIQFERVIIKPFKLRIDSSSISLVPGSRIVSKMKIEPRLIHISGPVSLVKSLKDSFYIQIPERSIESNYAERINLDFELPEQLKYEPAQVRVQFDIATFTQETVSVFPQLKNFPEGISVDLVEKVKLTVLIMPEDIEKLKNQDLDVLIDYNKINRTDSTLSIQLNNSPSFIREYFFTPATVRLVHE
jgi:YbbR domain-containing protein